MHHKFIRHDVQFLLLGILPAPALAETDCPTGLFAVVGSPLREDARGGGLFARMRHRRKIEVIHLRIAERRSPGAHSATNLVDKITNIVVDYDFRGPGAA